MIKETKDFGGGIYLINNRFGIDCDLKETILSIDTELKQLTAEQEEIHRWKVKWIDRIEQVKWTEFNKSLLSFDQSSFWSICN